MWTRILFAFFTVFSFSCSTLACEELLTIGGTLQTDYYHDQTRHHCHKLENQFTVQLDLMFDFKTERSWAFMQLEFENEAGIQHTKKQSKNQLAGSGEGDNLYLVKGFCGYALVDSPSYQLDYELGRHYLSDLFDSQIEFNNQFDGMLFRYTSKDTTKNHLKTTVGAFVTDYRYNRYGYAGQIDLSKIASTDLTLKYSLITWNTPKCKPRYNFINSQILASYHLPNDFKAYAAFLHNHAAKKHKSTDNTKAANGWYAGLTYGHVAKKNDWSLDFNYQVVQALAIPEWDIAGIGAYYPSGLSNYSYSLGGCSNYRGYVATILYALTDQINLLMLYQKAKPDNKSIGRSFKASTLEISVIYTF